MNKSDPTGSYEEDVHLRLTEYLALAVGFSRAEARTIAAADQGVDDNPKTSPYSGGISARTAYHFTTAAQRQVLRNEAFSNRSKEKFGIYLHALQDSYSHQKGLTDRDGEPYGAISGHLADGHAPDKTANRPELANKMAKATYQELRDFFQQTHDRDAPDGWSHLNGKIDFTTGLTN